MALFARRGNAFSLDVPIAGAIQTQADDINANGQITGAYIDADGVTHLFLMVGSKFTSFDFPESTSTLAWGIDSAGQVVGTYRNADGSAHSFLAPRGK